MLRRSFLFFLLLMLTATHGLSEEAREPKKLLLIADGGSHARGAHEHLPGLKILHKCLHDIPGVEVQLVQSDGEWPEGIELIDQADGVVLYLDQGARWIQQYPKRHEAILRLMEREGGFTAIHWATGAKDNRYVPFHKKLLGAVHGGDDRKYIHLDTEVKVVAKDHPITAGIDDMQLRDEFYYTLKRTGEGKLTPLLEADIEDTPELCCWALERPDGGRSFGFVCMHQHSSWAKEDLRRLIVQGVLWTIEVPTPEKLSLEITEADMKLPK